MALIHKVRKSPLDFINDDDIDNNHVGKPVRYVSLDRVYSTASICGGGSENVIMSKKVRARKLVVDGEEEEGDDLPLVHVYSRRRKRPRDCLKRPSFFESVVSRAGEVVPGVEVKSDSCEIEDSHVPRLKEEEEEEEEEELKEEKKKKKRRIGTNEMLKLGVDSSFFGSGFDRPRLRDYRNNVCDNNVNSNRKIGNLERKKPNGNNGLSFSANTKRWVR